MPDHVEDPPDFGGCDAEEATRPKGVYRLTLFVLFVIPSRLGGLARSYLSQEPVETTVIRLDLDSDS